MSNLLKTRQKGYSAPLVVVSTLVLLSLPLIYWFVSNTPNLSVSKNIKGATSIGTASARPGFNVTIASMSDTWDLVEYLCHDLDECLQSLNSGYRFGTVSGGKTDLHEIVVEYSQQWREYSYIKLYVRSGWYSIPRTFKVTALGSIPGSQIYTVKDEDLSYDVVIAPLSALQNNFYSSAVFSDQ